MPHAGSPLGTPTYDNSGQAMHPSIALFTSPWHGYRYWMSMTPFTGQDYTVENPSILVSQDGISWQVPDGLTNPVAPNEYRHLMDSELYYDNASDQLWLYYMKGTDNGAILLFRKSSDGIHWSAEQVLIQGPYDTMVSPAVEKVDGIYRLWTVNPQGKGIVNLVEYRTSTDGINWTSPQIVNLNQFGVQVWHIEIKWIESKKEYWAIYAGYLNGSNSGHTSLYIAKSSDGLNWTTFMRPALAPGPTGAWDSQQIYRTTFLYDPASDLLRVWYSASHDRVWHTGYTEINYTSFLRYLKQLAQQ
jgi:hypothetical protein